MEIGAGLEDLQFVMGKRGLRLRGNENLVVIGGDRLVLEISGRRSHCAASREV